MANILLLGMDPEPADQLSQVLAREGHRVWLATSLKDAPEECAADLVFSDSREGLWRGVLRQLQADRPEVPLIVVTRFPQIELWLDALEAGAQDYCAAPFEPAHLGWIVESALRTSSVTEPPRNRFPPRREPIAAHAIPSSL